MSAASGLPAGPAAKGDDAARPAGGAVRWAVVLAVVLTAVLEVLDSTIVNVAIPHIKSSFGATGDQITWVLTSYIVAAVIVTPLTGYFSRRLGRRTLIITAVCGFTAASALCGLSWSLESLVAFRLLQGVFGAFLIPLSQSILFDAFPREKRGQAMAMFGLGIIVAPVLGPTIGAFLTEYFSWRMVFYVNVPMAAFALLMLLGELPRSEPEDVGTDWAGLVLLAVAIGALQFTLDQGEMRDWFDSTLIQGTAVASVVAFVAFVRRGWGKADNIVDLSLFRDPNFAGASVAIAAFGISLYGSISILPLFVQGLLGFPILEAGYLFVPRGIAAGVSMVLVGSVLSRLVDPRVLVTIGLLLTAAGNLMLGGSTLESSYWELAWPGVVAGFGMGFVFVPLSTLAFDRVPAARQDEASGLYAVMRSLGSSIGIAIVGWLVVSRTQMHWHGLAADVTPFEPAVRAYLAPLGIAPTSAEGASLLAVEVARQAQLLAYLDVFRLLGWTALATLPVVLILRKPTGGASGHAAH